MINYVFKCQTTVFTACSAVYFHNNGGMVCLNMLLLWGGEPHHCLVTGAAIQTMLPNTVL
jgi:hypothetical protein